MDDNFRVSDYKGKTKLGKFSILKCSRRSRRPIWQDNKVKRSHYWLIISIIYIATCVCSVSWDVLIAEIRKGLKSFFRKICLETLSEKKVLVLSQWIFLALLLKWKGCVYIIWAFRKKKLCMSDNFLRGVEIKQKPTTYLCLGQLQPQMQKWGWIPSGHQAQILTPNMFFQLE